MADRRRDRLGGAFGLGGENNANQPNTQGGRTAQAAKRASKQKVIFFDASKKETHHPKSGFKKLFRKLRTVYKVEVNNEPISIDRLRECDVFVIGGPRERFSMAEFDALKLFLSGGGSVFLFLGEGGEARYETNVNYLLEDYGLSFNNDACVRTVYYKYLHPKEVYVANGIVNKEIVHAAWKLGQRRELKKQRDKDIADGKTPTGALGVRDGFSAGKKWGVLKGMKNMGGLSNPSLNDSIESPGKQDKHGITDAKDHSGLTFVFPYGCTINSQKPAMPILSSGYIAYPLNRPVAGVYSKQIRKGVQLADNTTVEESGAVSRLCVMGSTEIFGDAWLSKEENSKLQEVLFKWCLGEDNISMDPVDADDPDLNDYTYVPDTEALSERLRSCLQESEELPKDFTVLFEDELFKFDTNLIPEAIQLYKDLNIEHKPLTLIPPQFECPQPPLQPAVFPPTLREPPPPALDQFDLDEQFASERIRLAQLTNKCSEDDLDYFVREAGEILGVTGALQKDLTDAAEKDKDGKARAAEGKMGEADPLARFRGADGPKMILEYIFKQLVNFKKLNQETHNPNVMMGMNSATGNGTEQSGQGQPPVPSGPPPTQGQTQFMQF